MRMLSFKKHFLWSHGTVLHLAGKINSKIGGYIQLFFFFSKLTDSFAHLSRQKISQIRFTLMMNEINRNLAKLFFANLKNWVTRSEESLIIHRLHFFFLVEGKEGVLIFITCLPPFGNDQCRSWLRQGKGVNWFSISRTNQNEFFNMQTATAVINYTAVMIGRHVFFCIIPKKLVFLFENWIHFGGNIQKSRFPIFDYRYKSLVSTNLNQDC